jgi:hypothetical protein
MYDNGGRKLLFLSPPQTPTPPIRMNRANPRYTVNGHRIWGSVGNGGLHCLVGDTSITSR